MDPIVKTIQRAFLRWFTLPSVELGYRLQSVDVPAQVDY